MIKKPTLKGLKRVKQINNLRIYQDNSSVLFEFKVINPMGIILEEFLLLSNAIDFCKETKDFLKQNKFGRIEK
jgi:hypothetical protein